MHVWGFSDAADVFVLLAGISAMLAYGKAIERSGWLAGVQKVALRCARIYFYQVGLFLLTVGVVYFWTHAQNMPSTKLGPIFDAPAAGIFYGLTLRALPSYLDILPLYIILLAGFPLAYFLIRRSVWLALGVSASIWLLANIDGRIDLPNWMDGKGWDLNPFAWQFLFTIGMALCIAITARADGLLRYRRWLTIVAGLYLVGVFLEAAPFADWGLPNLRLFPLDAPDKSTLAWPRILDILALSYLLFSWPWFQRIAQRGWGETLAVCGRHSLEVFSASCALALFSRLLMRTYGDGLPLQIGVNVLCLAALILLARALDLRKKVGRAPMRQHLAAR